MLNVDNFYANFGQIVSDNEYIEVDGKQVFARDDRIYVLCPDHSQDPFMWFGYSNNYDGVVFKTNSGYLATVALFDAPVDETLKAVHLCQKLLGLAK